MLLSEMVKIKKESKLEEGKEEKFPFEASIFVYNIQKGQNICDLVSVKANY